MHKEEHALYYGLLASAANSLMSLLVRLNIGMPLIPTLFFRFSIGLLVMTPWLMRHRAHLFTKAHYKLHLIRDIAGLASVGSYFYTITTIPLINAAALANTGPLFVPLIVMIMMKKVVPRKRILALFIGFAGVLFILQPLGHKVGWGDMVGVFGGLMSAIVYVSIRQLSRVATPYSTVWTYFFVASVVLLLPTVVTWEPMRSTQIWVSLILIGLLSALFQYFLAQSISRAPVSKSSLMTYALVVFNGLFGWWFWGEVPTISNFIGVCLIVLGGVISFFDKGTPRNLANRPFS